MKTLFNDSDDLSAQDSLKTFTEDQQEPFTLCATGLKYKKISTILNKTEDSVRKLVDRAAMHFPLADGTWTVELAIRRATELGYMAKLFEKYRPKHRVYIERAENVVFKAKAENL